MSSIRLLIVVEGDAEEVFVKEILSPALALRGIYVVAKLNGEGSARSRRKGIKSWISVSRDIVRLFKEDPSCYITTFVDYYALPSGDDLNAWPGRNEAALRTQVEEKAVTIENALLSDLETKLPDANLQQRFIPYISMHEFEALLFSDPVAFSNGIGRSEMAKDMLEIKNQFPTPEHINDSPYTAPSKRLTSIFEKLSCGKYQKPIFGIIGAKNIGLPKIRTECRHFNDWLTRLESLCS